MTPRSPSIRKFSDIGVKIFSGIAGSVALFFLGWILWTVIRKGAAAFNWTFFFSSIPDGGIANAIVGTVILTLLAFLIAVPIGLLAGVFLSEFGGESPLANSVRFFCNVLMGTPSIIIGVFIYAVMVVPMKGFSGWAGGVALAILMLPVVTRTTEDMLALVPNTLRESALALGVPRWRVTLGVIFRAAKSGLVTGILLAVARVSGETAPLLFTAFNSDYWMESLSEPMPNMTVMIWDRAMSPYADWHEMAWGASLLITLGVLIVMLISRLFLRGRQ